MARVELDRTNGVFLSLQGLETYQDNESRLLDELTEVP